MSFHYQDQRKTVSPGLGFPHYMRNISSRIYPALLYLSATASQGSVDKSGHRRTESPVLPYVSIYVFDQQLYHTIVVLLQSPPSSISPAQRASTSPGSVDGGGLRRTESPALPDVNVCIQ